MGTAFSRPDILGHAQLSMTQDAYMTRASSAGGVRTAWTRAWSTRLRLG
jgi:hypothetical protein